MIDSTIPQRSLYLTTQLAELHIPMLLAFNMSDDAKRKGLKYNIPKLEKYFGSPIVQTVGSQTGGVRPLLSRLAQSLHELEDHGVPMLSYGSDVDDAIRAVTEKIDALDQTKYSHHYSRFFAIKLLEHDAAAMRIPELQPVASEVEAQIRHLWEVHAIEADTFMADRRYAMLSGACRETISMSHAKRREISDKIDTVMTNRYVSLPLFFLIIYATFWFTFTLAEPLMGGIESFFGWLNDFVKSVWNPETLPLLRTMLTDGVISGVGGVLVFLPNILFLFFAIAILEDSGYMSRAAFVMDGIMRKFGLQGRSFIPLILGFGCNVPAIMATRTIESERDRKVTILVLPLMSCGARLPIYAMVIPAFFAPKYQAFVMWLIYLIGVLTALIAARLMKSTLFKGDGEVYLMELPPYRMPTFRSLMLHMWDRGKMYLQKAGTIILGASILLFICNTFPRKTNLSQDYDSETEKLRQEMILTDSQIAVLEAGGVLKQEELETVKTDRILSSELLEAHAKETLPEALLPIFENARELQEKVEQLENRKRAEMLEYTISGRVGRALEPLFRFIGFDWKLTTASIAALAAKEVFVSQLGILYAEGEVDEESMPLREHLIKNYTPLQGFCIMLFSLLSIPCLATLAVIRRELNSWKMAALEAVGLFLFAFVTTAIVYQLGTLFRIGTKFLG